MKDCTLPVLFLYGISNVKYKNRNKYFKLPENLIQEDPKIDTFIRATLLGKYLESWLLYDSNISDELIYTIMNVKFKKENVKHLIKSLMSFNINKWYKYCCIIGILNTREEMLGFGNIKSIDEESKTQIYNYNLIREKRKRRVYQIPQQCLYGKTKRGSMTYDTSNIYELYDHEYIIENSKIIEKIKESFGSYEEFIEDVDELESFMKWYFPDDIPDEWPLEDQKKSHGYGVNQKNDKPVLRRYFNRWTDLKTNCKIWDKENIVSCCIQSIQNDFTTFNFEEDILKKYEQKKSIEYSLNMKSLKYSLLLE
jgi:hypothetical protein